MIKEKIPIAFVEDLEIDYKRIVTAIEDMNDFEIICAAKDGRDLIYKLSKLTTLPQLILMDMQMPKCCGLLATIICKRLFPSIKVVGLSCHTYNTVIDEFLAEGGDAFLAKYLLVKDTYPYNAYGNETIFEDYLHSILNSNEIIVDKFLEYKYGAHLNVTNTTLIIKQKFSNLKKDEITYLLLTAAGFSREEKAEIMYLSIAAIKKYYERLSKKIGVENHIDLIQFCMINGIAKTVKLYQSY